MLLLAVAVLSLAFWLRIALASRRRQNSFYVYNTSTPPDVLNGLTPQIDHVFAGDPVDWPAVTVIVPGRNEGHHLESTLTSLCSLDYPVGKLRIVFIDDQSTDNTAAVCAGLTARFPHLTVIHNTTPPPAGWLGKPWAIQQARSLITDASNLLLFTDADLRFHPLALRHAVRLLRHRGVDLVSFIPRLECRSLPELLGLSAGMFLIFTKLPFALTNDPRSRLTLAAGGFSLFRREAYLAIGGHECVRAQVIEDIALAKTLRAAGRPLFAALTHDLYSARMYDGLRDTFRGLRKNAFAGANYNTPLAIFFAAVLALCAAALPLTSIAAVFYWITAPSLLTLGTCIAALAAAWLMFSTAARDARTLAFPWYTPALFPVAVAFYTSILLASVISHHRGGAHWAGRQLHSTTVQPLKSIK